MKIKKHVTDKVLRANRMNAQRSTGPKNLESIKHNACTHRMLSKNLYFHNEEEKREFQEMLTQLQADQNASGMLKRLLVEEAATCIWKLRMSEEWEWKEVLQRARTAKAVLQVVAENNDNEHLLLHNYGRQAVQRGWDLQELVIRTDSSNADESSSGKKRESGQINMEAKLTRSLDTVMRYRSSIKKNLYRAIATLSGMRDAGDGGRTL